MPPLRCAAATAAAAAVAHAMLYIFAIYFTQHKFICGCNFNSRATVASTLLLPLLLLPLRSLLVVFVIVAAASLVNALHFVATVRERSKEASEDSSRLQQVVALSESLSNLSLL